MPNKKSLFGVQMIDLQRAWAVGLDAEVWHSTDGGQTWVQVKIPATQALYSVAFDGDLGWAVGDSGTVLVTSDRGATWRLLPVPLDLKLFWIHAVSLVPGTSGNRGMLVGANGLMRWTHHDQMLQN